MSPTEALSTMYIECDTNNCRQTKPSMAHFRPIKEHECDVYIDSMDSPLEGVKMFPIVNNDPSNKPIETETPICSKKPSYYKSSRSGEDHGLGKFNRPIKKRRRRKSESNSKTIKVSPLYFIEFFLLKYSIFNFC